VATNVKSLILTSNGLITGYIVAKSAEEYLQLINKTGLDAWDEEEFVYLEDVEIRAHRNTVKLPYLFLFHDDIKGISVAPESKSSFFA
jgi:hypothetical protein